jgi:hypothetical protein
MRKGRFGEYKVILGSMLPTIDLRLAYTNRSEVGSFGVNVYIDSDVTYRRIKDSEVLLIGYTMPASTAILASDEQVLLCYTFLSAILALWVDTYEHAKVNPQY